MVDKLVAPTNDEMKLVISHLSRTSHATNVKNGFWDEWYAICSLAFAGGDDIAREVTKDRLKEMYIAEKLALVHSEISEALEGLRKNNIDAPDSKLENYRNFSVELADTCIRCLDLAEGVGLHDPDDETINEVAAAWVDKAAYNSTRPYKHGKKF